MNSIGSRIREARVSQQKSLNDVASRAKISAATLSRIETEKQGVGISLFLLLAKVLKVNPNELLGEQDAPEGGDPIVQKLAAMHPSQRTEFWNELSAIRRDGRSKRAHEGNGANVAPQIEELLAQIDYLRGEVDAMRMRMSARQRARR